MMKKLKKVSENSDNSGMPHSGYKGIILTVFKSKGEKTMAKALNPRDIYNDFVDGVGILSQSNPDFMAKFIDIDSSCGGEVLSPKTKELIGVAIGLYNRCQYCICVHTRGAYQAGATREEILAAAEVAIAFGGGPSVAYSAGLLTAALDEFEHDFD